MPCVFRRAFTAGLVAATLIASLEAADSGSRTSSSATRASTAERAVDIDNFGRISDTYYRGAQPIGDDYADLAALGIKTVINLTSDDALAEEPEMVERAGMKYLAMPMTTRVPPTDEQLALFLRVVNDPASQPVYVHCVGGKHRTGVMTAIYRMSQNSWTADRAYDEMKDFKFGSSWLHPEFKKFVYGYRAPLLESKAAN
jgi:tyrosine-protein phosphatase SIW14